MGSQPDVEGKTKKNSKTALLLLQVVVGPGTTSPTSFSQPSPCFLSTAAFFLHFFLCGLETCLSVHHGAPYIHPAPQRCSPNPGFPAVPVSALRSDYSLEEQRSFHYYCPGSNLKRISRAGARQGCKRITSRWKQRSLSHWLRCSALQGQWGGTAEVQMGG